MEEEYSFGKGSVFQILDDMAALREERAKENNDVYNVDNYSSPKQHLTVCEKGESNNGAYYNEENSRIEQYNKYAYYEESYSSPQKHAENCVDKRDYKSRKEYLKAKYGSLAKYKKEKGIDYSNAKTQFPQSDNIKGYSYINDNSPEKEDKTEIIDNLDPAKSDVKDDDLPKKENKAIITEIKKYIKDKIKKIIKYVKDKITEIIKDVKDNLNPVNWGILFWITVIVSVIDPYIFLYFFFNLSITSLLSKEKKSKLRGKIIILLILSIFLVYTKILLTNT